MTGAPGGRTRGTREGKGVGTEILAWVGAVLSSLFRLPQAYRAARTDDLAVLAPGSYWLMPADAVVWSAWAVITDQLAAGVPGLVNGRGGRPHPDPTVRRPAQRWGGRRSTGDAVAV